MYIDAKVIHVRTTEEKEIRIRVRGYNSLSQLEEDFCWITKDMLKEVLGETDGN